MRICMVVRAALWWLIALRPCVAQPIICRPKRVEICRLCNISLRSCSPCRPYSNCARSAQLETSVCHIGEEKSKLPEFTRCTFGSRRLDLDRVTHSIMKSGYNHSALLPELNAARTISAASFEHAPRVNVGPKAVQEYKIVDAQALLKPLLELYRTRVNSEAAALSDMLLKLMLPHIHLDGKQLQLSDLVFYGFNLERGAYYPDMHWDTDWNMFPNAAGFQLWYMLEEPDEKITGEWGNMFLARTPELLPNDLPLYMRVNEDGSLTKNLHLMYAMHPVMGWGRWQDANLSFEYLRPKPGEVLIFSKRTLHFSDPRPYMHGLKVDRLVMNMRVIVKHPQYGVPFQPNHPYVQSVPKHIKESWAPVDHQAGGLHHMQGIHRWDWLFKAGRGFSPENSSKFNLNGLAEKELSTACLKPEDTAHHAGRWRFALGEKKHKRPERRNSPPRRIV